MANVTLSGGINRQQASWHTAQEGVACQGAGPRNLSVKSEAIVP